MKHRKALVLLILAAALTTAGAVAAAGAPPAAVPVFPPPLASYGDSGAGNIPAILAHRIREHPFNLIATLIFFCAVVPTFLTGWFMAVSHRWSQEHKEKIRKGKSPRESVHHGAELFHFLGEVEAVFGIWAAFTVGAIVFFFDWPTAKGYILSGVNFTEPMFVVVIMTLAATRPILQVSERLPGGSTPESGLRSGSTTSSPFDTDSDFTPDFDGKQLSGREMRARPALTL